MGNTLSTTTSPKETPNEHLLNLSHSIDENTKSLIAALNAKGLEAPSFGVDGSPDFTLAQTDKDAVATRDQLITQTKQLHDLLVGPRQGMKALVMEIFSHISIHAICEFKVAEFVPKEGSISYHDLTASVAEKTGTDLSVPALRKMVRLAIMNNIFSEPQPGHVAHNRSSLLLVEEHEIANFMACFTKDLFVACANSVEAMKKWPECQEPNETGVNLAFGHRLKWFDHMQSDAGRAHRFESMLHANGSRDGFEVSHTVDSFEWESLGEATIVDVGGLDGFVAAAVAEKHTSLKFIVQDLPKMRTNNLNGKVPKHLRDRVELTAHDCFTPQPEVADAYFFRFVFHAFSDKYAVKTLRSLVPALQPGARVIINDLVLPAPGSLPRMVEKSIRTMDVLVQSVCNASEREIEDWKRLFEVADSRYKWKGAYKGTGKLWFIEAVWDP